MKNVQTQLFIELFSGDLSSTIYPLTGIRVTDYLFSAMQEWARAKNNQFFDKYDFLAIYKSISISQSNKIFQVYLNFY